MAQKAGGVAAKVEEIIRETVENCDVRLWDVRYEKEGPGWYLKVLIDRDTPLDTDTCEAVSRAIDPLLDEADVIAQSYFLEVGSPGLGRKLTREEHFTAMQGREVRARFYAPDDKGRRDVAGLLLGKTAGHLRLQTPDGCEELPLQSVADVKSTDDENLFG